MDRRAFLAVATIAPLSGCTGLFGGGENGRLDLTVRNDGDDSVTVRVRVVDDEGTTFEDESERIDGGVARTFEVSVGTAGRHEVTVSGDDWRGMLAWNADTCGLFEATVGFTRERVDVAGECATPR